MATSLRSSALLLGAVAGVALRATPIRVSTIGDSITAGVCGGNTGGWPAMLQTILGSGYVVTNFGNSGKTMLKKGLCGPTGGDCAYWDTPSWPAALASTPDIVTIMLGTNDAKEFNWFNASTGNYTADFISMITTVAALPTNPDIYVMIPPPLYPPYPYDMNKTVINEDLPALLPALFGNGGFGVKGIIDVFDALGGKNLSQPNITCDGCHPKPAGYAEIAQAVSKVLLAAAAAEDGTAGSLSSLRGGNTQ